jgi:hypothetical protein
MKQKILVVDDKIRSIIQQAVIVYSTMRFIWAMSNSECLKVGQGRENGQ